MIDWEVAKSSLIYMVGLFAKFALFVIVLLEAGHYIHPIFGPVAVIALFIFYMEYTSRVEIKRLDKQWKDALDDLEKNRETLTKNVRFDDDDED